MVNLAESADHLAHLLTHVRKDLYFTALGIFAQFRFLPGGCDEDGGSLPGYDGSRLSPISAKEIAIVIMIHNHDAQPALFADQGLCLPDTIKANTHRCISLDPSCSKRRGPAFVLGWPVGSKINAHPGASGCLSGRMMSTPLHRPIMQGEDELRSHFTA
jgi:hypothetical protein